MKEKHTAYYSFLCTFILFFTCASVNASVVIDGTRVIYPSDVREVTVKLSNNGKRPVLVQSWIDMGNPDDVPDKVTTPFVLTPPVNRVDAGTGQTLRIRGTNTSTLRQDRESVYWLNVLEIPAKPGEAAQQQNYLQLALRTRIKLFYRPVGLQGNPMKAPEELIWKVKSGKLSAYNPTSYNVSLSQVIVNGKTIPADMVSPKGEATINVSANPGTKITAFWVNDYGATNSGDFIVN